MHGIFTGNMHRNCTQHDEQGYHYRIRNGVSKKLFFTKLAVFMSIQTVFKQTIFGNPFWCRKLIFLFSCLFSNFHSKTGQLQLKTNKNKLSLAGGIFKKRENFHLANLLFQGTCLFEHCLNRHENSQFGENHCSTTDSGHCIV